MNPSPILSITNTITIGTMLNFNNGNNGHELKKTLRVKRRQVVKLTDDTSRSLSLLCEPDIMRNF